MHKTSKQDIEYLFEAFVNLKSPAECRKFLRDLLTENEIAEFAERWKAARMLRAGAPYTRIEEETGLSSRTIARVQKWLTEGAGGYAMMLRRLPHQEEEGNGGRRSRQSKKTAKEG